MVKQPYFMSRTRDSNSTDKLGVDDVFILRPPPSMFRFKGIYS